MNVRGLRFWVVMMVLVGLASSVWAQTTGGRAPGRYGMSPGQAAESTDVNQPIIPTMPSGAMQAPSGTVPEYVLGVGDRLRITIYGEDDLSGEYEINSTGVVAFPLIGNVSAARQPVRDFESALRNKLAEGYLHDPRVSVQVTNYRPFFILGEVAKPGSYPYVNGMNVLNAVALAGGYTYRADQNDVVIVHANDPAKTEQKAREDSPVMPGDIIRVPERFF